jgi:hypothetical protein
MYEPKAIQEALMRRGINITVALVLIALIIKIMAVPTHTVANTDASRNTVSVYDLETAYPNMNVLPVQEEPKP